MNSRVALITFLDGESGRPDNSLPSGPPNYPSGGPVFPGYPVDPGYGQGRPWPNRPDNSLPGSGNYPSTGPVFPPVTIDNTLPESETPNPPSLSLPIVLPPIINPAPPGHVRKFELKYSVRYGWVLVPTADEVAEPK